MSDPIERCPLCRFEGTDVYAHVLTSHRKSAIANALLERRRAPDP